MELRRELLWAISTLVGMNLLLAFGAIGLFTRMGPAIDRIMQENVYSIVAAEEILSRLATSDGGTIEPAVRLRMDRAVGRIAENVTEAEETPLVESLRALLPQVVAGNQQARKRFVADIGRLIRINRAAMKRVDEEAQRLGSAGAWAAVFVGVISFLASWLVVVRLQRRLVLPILDLHGVLENARVGDRLRRCRHADAPREVVEVTREVNMLLDERLRSEANSRSMAAKRP